MSDLGERSGPPYGSAAGIPLPPDVSTLPVPGAGLGPVGGARRRQRWLRLGFVVPVVAVIVVIALLNGSEADGNGLSGLQPGDCIEAPDATGFTKITTVDCAGPHVQEVYAVGTTSATLATGMDAVHDPEIIRICRTSVDRRILDLLARTARTSAGFLVGSTKTGRVVCTVISEEPRTGSLVASATRTGES